MRRILFFPVIVLVAGLGFIIGVLVWTLDESNAHNQEVRALEVVATTLMTAEGFRAKPYHDSRGVLTIGYGTNIGEGISKAEATYLMRERLRGVEGLIRAGSPAYDGLPLKARAALLEMGYQLGAHGLLEFDDMLTAIKVRDWDTAANAALDSVWAREEVPKRAKRISDALRSLDTAN